jgi:hypothetical protein
VVRDTRQGIDPQLRPLLFQRFRQLDASKTRLHGGLGLGLSIVRHLAEAHGGNVSAESEGEGRGSTFRVMLPLRAVDDVAKQAASTRNSAQTLFSKASQPWSLMMMPTRASLLGMCSTGGGGCDDGGICRRGVAPP